MSENEDDTSGVLDDADLLEAVEAAELEEERLHERQQRRPRRRVVTINRAPVLTLWAYVVARRLGHPEATALTLGRAVAIKYALTKGESLGVIKGSAGARRVGVPPWRIYTAGTVPTNEKVYLRQRAIEFFNNVFTVQLVNGTTLLTILDGKPMEPDAVKVYLRTHLGSQQQQDDLTASLTALANALTPAQLGGNGAYDVYVQFRPEVPPGFDGWGQAGELDLDRIDELIAGPNSAEPASSSPSSSSLSANPKRIKTDVN